MPPKNKRPSQAERKLALEEAQSDRWDRLVTFPFFVVDKAISWPGAIIFLGYFYFVLGAEHFAGVTTNLAIKIATDFGGEDKLAWGAAGILFVSNIVTGWAFRAYIKRKGQREKALEQMIDADRSSSGLKNTGQP